MSKASELQDRLSRIEAEFDREMRARGFDPAQADNIPLTRHLTLLYRQRARLRADLAEVEDKSKSDE
jgi:2'-5' RNA ligase